MSAEKSEEPTPKKLRDARQKGQVAHSKDVTTTALLLAVFAYLAVGWKWIEGKLLEAVTLPAAFMDRPFEDAVPAVAKALLSTAVEICLPLLAIVIVTTVAVSVAQTGFLLTMDPVKFDLKKLDPIDKLKQIVSMKNFIEFLKSCAKVAILAAAVTMVVRDSLEPLVHSTSGELPGVGYCLRASVLHLAWWTAATYFVVAAADFWFQRRQFVKGLRMSKDEVKREYKESEGDPHIKGKRKQLHQEMVRGDVAGKVKKSTVLVTNPTHKAVALFHRQGETPLPRIEAMGEDHMAEQMIRIAQEAGVPIVRNIPLAWALFENGKVEDYIPADLIEPVAEVLRWVMEIARENGLQTDGGCA